MTDQIMEILRVLAEKFGTTTEFLWGIMVRQAYVVGISQILAFVMAGLFVFAWNRYVWSIRLPEDPQEDRGGDKTFGIMMVRLFGVVGACMWAMMFLCGLTEITTALVNPEYWAIKQVGQLFTK
jgi:hypothetical protein